MSDGAVGFEPSNAAITGSSAGVRLTGGEAAAGRSPPAGFAGAARAVLPLAGVCSKSCAGAVSDPASRAIAANSSL